MSHLESKLVASERKWIKFLLSICFIGQLAFVTMVVVVRTGFVARENLSVAPDVAMGLALASLVFATISGVRLELFKQNKM